MLKKFKKIIKYILSLSKQIFLLILVLVILFTLEFLRNEFYFSGNKFETGQYSFTKEEYISPEQKIAISKQTVKDAQKVANELFFSSEDRSNLQNKAKKFMLN